MRIVSALAMIRAIGWRSTGAISRPIAALEAVCAVGAGTAGGPPAARSATSSRSNPACQARAARAGPDARSRSARSPDRRPAHHRAVASGAAGLPRHPRVRRNRSTVGRGPPPCVRRVSPSRRARLDGDQLLRRPQPGGKLAQLARDGGTARGGRAVGLLAERRRLPARDVDRAPGPALLGHDLDPRGDLLGIVLRAQGLRQAQAVMPRLANQREERRAGDDPGQLAAAAQLQPGERLVGLDQPVACVGARPSRERGRRRHRLTAPLRQVTQSGAPPRCRRAAVRNPRAIPLPGWR